VNLYRGEEIGGGEVMPLLSSVDQVQPVGQIAKKPELARDDLIPASTYAKATPFVRLQMEGTRTQPMRQSAFREGEPR
jgi:hypothetical protein